MKSNYSSQLQKHRPQKSSASSASATTTFLPMMCTLTAAKDVKLPSRCQRGRSSSSPEAEPSSPTVGCMGQVKRNNKVVAFPSTTLFKHFDHKIASTTDITNNKIIKYHKLKRFFSAKSLTGSPPAAASTFTSAARPTTAAGTRKVKKINGGNAAVSNNRARDIAGGIDHHHQNERRLVSRSKKVDNWNQVRSEKACLVNLEELDPPLPVVKRPPLQRWRLEEEGKREESMSLWKRRSGGVPLKSLQVQVIHPNQTLLVPAKTV